MKKQLIYLLLVLALFSCKKKKDLRDPYIGTWQTTSLTEKTDTSETIVSTSCALTFAKDPDDEESSPFNPVTFNDDAFILGPLSELRADQCIDYYGTSQYGCYWYFDDYRMFIWGIGPFKDHVVVCTLTKEKKQMTLLYVQANDSPGTGNSFTLKQKIVLQKQ